jgi:myosin heavy subunit
MLVLTLCNPLPGIVLVALNPYQKLPIYEHNIIQAYAKKSIGVLSSFLFIYYSY